MSRADKEKEIKTLVVEKKSPKTFKKSHYPQGFWGLMRRVLTPGWKPAVNYNPPDHTPPTAGWTPATNGSENELTNPIFQSKRGRSS